jgi:hypothetical protein
MIDEDSVQATKDQRKYRAFKRFKHDSSQCMAVPIFKEVLHKLLVIVAEPDKPANAEYDQHEEKEQHEDVC